MGFTINVFLYSDDINKKNRVKLLNTIRICPEDFDGLEETVSDPPADSLQTLFGSAEAMIKEAKEGVNKHLKRKRSRVLAASFAQKYLEGVNSNSWFSTQLF